MSNLNWALGETGASIVGVSLESICELGHVTNLLNADESTRWLAGTAPQHVIIKLASKHPPLHYVGWEVSQHTTNNVKTLEIAIASSLDEQEELEQQSIFARKMKAIVRCEAIPGAGLQLWRLPTPVTEDIKYIRFIVLSTFDNGAVSLNNLYLLEHANGFISHENTPFVESSIKCDERASAEKQTTLFLSNSNYISNIADSQRNAVLPFASTLLRPPSSSSSSREQSYLNKLNDTEKFIQLKVTLPSVTFPRKEELEVQKQEQQSKEPSSNKDSTIKEDKHVQKDMHNEMEADIACGLERSEAQKKKEEVFTPGVSPTEPRVPSQTATSQNNSTIPHRSPSSRVQQLLKDLNDDICMLKPIKVISPRRNLLHYLPDNLPEELYNFELGAERELDNYRGSEGIGSELFSRAHIRHSPTRDRERHQQQQQQQLISQRRQKQRTDHSNTKQHNQRNGSNHSKQVNNSKNEDHNDEDKVQKCKTENVDKYAKEHNVNDGVKSKKEKHHKKHTHRHHSPHSQRKQSNSNGTNNKCEDENTAVVYTKRIEHLERVVASLTTVVQQQREDLSIIKQALLRQCLQNRYDDSNSNRTENATCRINCSSTSNAKCNNQVDESSTKSPFRSNALSPLTVEPNGHNQKDLPSSSNERNLHEHDDWRNECDKQKSDKMGSDEHEPNSALRHHVRSYLNKYLRKEAKKLESASFAKIDNYLHDITQRISDATNYDTTKTKNNDHIKVKIETLPSASSASQQISSTPSPHHYTPEAVKSEEHEYIPVYFRTVPSIQEPAMEVKRENL